MLFRSWAALLYLSAMLAPDSRSEDRAAGELVSAAQPPSSASLAAVQDDPDSPVHGISLDQLQGSSSMPVSGWADPLTSERFLRLVDEGVHHRPGSLPARRVRHYFMDETLWSHPASDLRILSTTPREEVIFLELDVY